MLGYDARVDSAAYVEVRPNPKEAGFAGLNEIGQNLVGDRLMKCPLVSKRPDVELQRLELDAARLRHVLDVQRGEVGLPGPRTETGKLGQSNADGVVTLRIRILETLQMLARASGHLFSDANCRRLKAIAGLQL